MINIKLPSTRGLKIISELDSLFQDTLNILIENENKDNIFNWLENEINNYKRYFSVFFLYCKTFYITNK